MFAFSNQQEEKKCLKKQIPCTTESNIFTRRVASNHRSMDARKCTFSSLDYSIRDLWTNRSPQHMQIFVRAH